VDNIRGKISDLRDLGFSDPVKMITLFPAILGLGRVDKSIDAGIEN
jgi:hypothetical protein